MTATYTFDVFTSLDGFGAPTPTADWGGYWGKQGPELLERRYNQYGEDFRMVFGASTYRLHAKFKNMGITFDPWVNRMLNAPTTVLSNTLQGPLEWPNATVASGDAVEIVAKLKEESDVPLRSHGSLSLNRALMAAGLVSQGLAI
ncbi:dihydrofolate reductase family protein, partial [Kibdelosporangium lantanae]